MPLISGMFQSDNTKSGGAARIASSASLLSAASAASQCRTRLAQRISPTGDDGRRAHGAGARCAPWPAGDLGLGPPAAS